LLIEPRELVRVTAHDLMSRAGMRIDSAASLQQAREGLQDGAPDIIVTGLPIDDEGVTALLDDVRMVQPRLRVIQLVDDANAFAFSVPGSDSPAQVGRHDMARTLVPAVAQELDAAWAV
jgi:DNA-binding NtrC family response regulator